MTFDQLDYDALMTDPMTWPVHLQADAFADTARRIHKTGTVVLGCFDAVPRMKTELAAEYRRLKKHLRRGKICAEGFRESLATVHDVLSASGLLGCGRSKFDDLAYEIEIAIVFGQMLEAIFGPGWTLDRFTPANITAFLRAMEDSLTATPH